MGWESIGVEYWMDVGGFLLDGCGWVCIGWMLVDFYWMDVGGFVLDGCWWVCIGWMLVGLYWMDVGGY